MKKRLLLITLISVTLISAPAISGPATNDLGTCLIDSLNGKERKQLAKWIFLAIAAHPEMQQFSNVTKKVQDDTDKYIGRLITKLLADDCFAETKLAIDTGGSVALTSAFELVGKVAMQELMTNNDVNVAISGFEKYMDKEKLETLN